MALNPLFSSNEQRLGGGYRVQREPVGYHDWAVRGRGGGGEGQD